MGKGADPTERKLHPVARESRGEEKRRQAFKGCAIKVSQTTGSASVGNRTSPGNGQMAQNSTT
ncbi:hypothetical protein KIL84_004506, partial [Mauremys mutica]